MHKYTISTPTPSIPLDNSGSGTASFTVTNISGVPDRGMAKVVPQGSTKPEWLSIAGNTDREFTANGVNQYDVKIAVPAGTPAGSFAFRFDMASSTRRTAEEYDEGPTVKFDVKAAEKKTPAWWIWVAAAVAIALVAGVVVWLVTRGTAVPDVTRKPFIDAIKQVQSAGFKVALAAQNDDHDPPGNVVDQDPKKKAKKNSVVKLTVATHGSPDLTLAEADAAQLTDATATRLQNAVNPPPPPPAQKVTVPPVVGMAAEQAELQIYRAGLKPETVTAIVPFGPLGTVIREDPAAGGQVDAGTPVRLTIASRFHGPWRHDAAWTSKLDDARRDYEKNMRILGRNP